MINTIYMKQNNIYIYILIDYYRGKIASLRDGVGARILAYKACGLVLSYYFYLFRACGDSPLSSRRILTRLRAKTLIDSYISTLAEKDGSLSLFLSLRRDSFRRVSELVSVIVDVT